MVLSINDDFRVGYTDGITAGGSASYSADGKILTLTSNEGVGNAAYKQWYFMASPGDIIEFSIWASTLMGKPEIIFDLKSSTNTTIKSIYRLELLSTEWKQYNVRFAVPENAEGYVAIALILGIGNASVPQANVSFMQPKLKVSSSNIGSDQILAMGLVGVVNGVATLHQSYKRYGIKDVTYDDSTKKVTVTLSKRTIYNVMPNIQVTSGSTLVSTIPIAGEYTDAEFPTFKMAMTNGTSLVSLMSGTYFFWVRVGY